MPRKRYSTEQIITKLRQAEPGAGHRGLGLSKSSEALDDFPRLFLRLFLRVTPVAPVSRQQTTLSVNSSLPQDSVTRPPTSPAGQAGSGT